MEQNYARLTEQFNECKDLIPFSRMEQRGEQTLFGDVLEWCRDRYNEPKNVALAYMLVGYWHTKREVERRFR